MPKTPWFESWFDSPFYHILYKNRDEKEAEYFVENLVAFLKPKESSTFLDLACGKGRHAIHVNSLGFDVTGTDLSACSISHANQYAKENLRFEVQDMREPLERKFDFVLNLFTSFGYFDNEHDHHRVIHSVREMLNPNGIFVLDYLNENQVLDNLIPEETIVREGITFHISRKEEDKKLIKTIAFEHEGKPYCFQESVKLFSRQELEAILKNAGFVIKTNFGNYCLKEEFNSDSQRLILIAEKA